MNSMTVVGYTTNDGDMLCCDCGDDTGPAAHRKGMWGEAVFCGFEVDSPAHCAECKALIEGQVLTGDGRDYVAGKLLDAKAPTDVLDSWETLLQGGGNTQRRHDDACRVYIWRRAKSVLLGGQPQGAIPEPLRSVLDDGDTLAERLAER